MLLSPTRATTFSRHSPARVGFPRNERLPHALFLAYRGAEKIVPQLVGQISETGLPMAVAELRWGQNVVLIEQIKDLRELTPATPRASRL